MLTLPSFFFVGTPLWEDPLAQQFLQALRKVGRADSRERERHKVLEYAAQLSDPNGMCCQREEDSPMMCALQHLPSHCEAFLLRVLHVLLQRGAHPDVAARDHTTALHVAVLGHHSQAVRLLLAWNASPDPNPFLSPAPCYWALRQCMHPPGSRHASSPSETFLQDFSSLTELLKAKGQVVQRFSEDKLRSDERDTWPKDYPARVVLDLIKEVKKLCNGQGVGTSKELFQEKVDREVCRARQRMKDLCETQQLEDSSSFLA